MSDPDSEADAGEALPEALPSRASSERTARTLAEALPYIQRFDRKTVVIKYGGHAMADGALSRAFAQDVVLLRQLGLRPVVVHGGGPQIASMLERLGMESRFENGLRVTDRDTMEVVEMVLSGRINKQIVRAIGEAGGRAVGLSGSDGGLIRARKAAPRDPVGNIEKATDLGFVGEPDAIDTQVLGALLEAGQDIIPVVAPVGVGPEGERYNINADTAAGALASALGASRLMLLTDVAGVMNRSGQLIHALAHHEVGKLIAEGTAVGGMIPKLETAARAVNLGVEAAVIMDGRSPHVLLMELFTEYGAGTLIS